MSCPAKLLILAFFGSFASPILAIGSDTTNIILTDSEKFTFTIMTSYAVPRDAAGEPQAQRNDDGTLRSLSFRIPYIQVINSKGEIVRKSLLDPTTQVGLNEKVSRGFCNLIGMEWVSTVNGTNDTVAEEDAVTALSLAYPRKSQDEIFGLVEEQFPTSVVLDENSAFGSETFTIGRGNRAINVLVGTTCVPRK